MVRLKTDFKEASTWRGLVAVITAIGIVLYPDRISEIVPAGLAIMGGIGMVMSDKQ
jgi:hypothetical protein